MGHLPGVLWAGVIAALLVAGCNQAQTRTFLTIATSTSGGTFYLVGGKLADMITKYIPGAQATAEVTAGGIENARQIKNKKTDIAFLPGDTLHNAVNGLAEFKGIKIPMLQIAALFPTPLQIVTLEEYGIKSIADLRGKRVSLGAPGSSTAVRGEIVLKAHGLSLSDIKVDKTTSSESARQLLDGQIDAAVYSSAAPMAAIMEVASQSRIVLLSVTPDAMNKIEQEHPDLFKVVIPGKSYPGIEAPATCVASMTILVTRPDMDEELIYQITKMLFEKRSDFITAHKVLAADFALDMAMSEQRLAPFHPGALTYYKEKGLVK